MTFEEWWNTKDYPTRCKGNCMEAFNAGLHADVHTDNSKVIAELNDKLNNLARVAEVRLANWQKYEKENAELKKESNQLFLEGAKRVEELEAQIDNLKSIGKTAYIKGIRTMANALKEYDRTEGAWTDYFEHKVDETLKMLLKRGVIKENLTTKVECETQELLDKQIEATYKVVEKLNKAKELVKALLDVFVYDLADDELDSGDIVYIERAEKFLKEKEND